MNCFLSNVYVVNGFVHSMGKGFSVVKELMMVRMIIVMMDLCLVAHELNRPLVKRDSQKNGDDNDDDDLSHD